MRFLDNLEIYLTEEKELYDIYPVDYDAESGVSFGVDLDKDDKRVASVKIKTIDGAPIDALGGDYDYKEVYGDIDFVGDIDDPSKVPLLTWIVKKLTSLGYDQTSIRIDGREVFKKPEDLDKEIDEPVEASEEDIDFSDYWKGNDEDEDETPTDTEYDFDSSSDYTSDEEESPKRIKKTKKIKKTVDDEEEDETENFKR